MQFNEYLRMLRELNHFSKVQIARYINIAAPNVSKYEDGSVVPTTEKLRKISDLFGLSNDKKLKLANLCFEARIRGKDEEKLLGYIHELESLSKLKIDEQKVVLKDKNQDRYIEVTQEKFEMLEKLNRLSESQQELVVKMINGL